ncbi:hypothetical protein [Hydrogenophaga sp. BPS33]|uniref:hypothetical protein n=1 Tax=Hydrogenophaga sp. BPS33 TaxID=2651974 RepID=UPI00132041DD|nr:hypothetical protein [Hydrogenophaga sp. BPS33]QHE84523.1 zinc dependent phospholipase C family protein [Hydrogenophaga sp. BPS33]
MTKRLKVSGSQQPKATAWLLGFAAHMATDMTIHPVIESTALNLACPRMKDIDPTYTTQLNSPESPMDYAVIYERARRNVLAVWKGLDDALVQGRSNALDALEDWNLDTGRSVQTEKLVFWLGAARFGGAGFRSAKRLHQLTTATS